MVRKLCDFWTANSRSATESAEASQGRVRTCRKVNELATYFISILRLGKSYTIRLQERLVVWCACNYLNNIYGVVEIVKSVVELTISFY